MDRRDRAAMEGDWYNSFDEDRMEATINLENDEGDEEEITVHCKYEVCSTCEGKGTHVNPSIDSNGLTAEDFDEDPNFKEQYFNGAFDVTCYGCKGKRVEVVVDWERIKREDEKLHKRLEEYFESRADDMREREAEMRYGY
jgi:hypothetical protein